MTLSVRLYEDSVLLGWSNVISKRNETDFRAPYNGTRRPRAVVEVLQYSFFTLRYRWWWVFNRFTSTKETRYPLYTSLDGPQGRSRLVREISLPREFDPRIVQPIASRYTGWAIVAHIQEKQNSVQSLFEFSALRSGVAGDFSLQGQDPEYSLTRTESSTVSLRKPDDIQITCTEDTICHFRYESYTTLASSKFDRGHPVVLILTNNIQYFSFRLNSFIYT